jgi:hypothetical protein
MVDCSIPMIGLNFVDAISTEAMNQYRKTDDSYQTKENDVMTGE